MVIQKILFFTEIMYKKNNKNSDYLQSVNFYIFEIKIENFNFQYINFHLK